MEELNYPLVSVVMITYNQDSHINQAVTSVLDQTYKGDIEVIIADDSSTDKTESIILDIVKNHPNGHWIKYTKHKVNKGIFRNSIWALKKVKGKYVALCEGDDFWTDHFKLQKQSNFLEKNQQYSLCFHSVDIQNEIKKSNYPEVAAENREYNIDELLLTKVAHTVSFLFKIQSLQVKPFSFKLVFGGDVYLMLALAESGKVFGISDTMGVYRIHRDGISNLDPERIGISHQKRFIHQYIFFKKTFTSLSNQAINAKIVDYCMVVSKYYYNRKNPQALFYLTLALYYRPDLISKGFKKIIK